MLGYMRRLPEALERTLPLPATQEAQTAVRNQPGDVAAGEGVVDGEEPREEDTDIAVGLGSDSRPDS